jgi:hypothetical protein
MMRIRTLVTNWAASNVSKALDEGADIVIHETNRGYEGGTRGHFCNITTRSEILRDQINAEFKWRVGHAPIEGDFTLLVFPQRSDEVIADRVNRFLSTFDPPS